MFYRILDDGGILGHALLLCIIPRRLATNCSGSSRNTKAEPSLAGGLVFRFAPGQPLKRALGRTGGWDLLELNKLGDTLKAVLTQDKLPEEVVWHYLNRLESQHDGANKTLSRRFTGLIIAWAIIAGIASGTVTGGSVSSFQISSLSSLLGFGPLIIAIFQYGIFSSLLSIHVLREGVQKCYERLAPELVQKNLHYLTNTPTFFTVEEFIDRASWMSHSILRSKINAFFTLTVYLSIPFGSIPIFVHASYLAYTHGTWWWPYTTFMITVSAVFWIRGLLSWITVTKWSE